MGGACGDDTHLIHLCRGGGANDSCSALLSGSKDPMIKALEDKPRPLTWVSSSYASSMIIGRCPDASLFCLHDADHQREIKGVRRIADLAGTIVCGRVPVKDGGAAANRGQRNAGAERRGNAGTECRSRTPRCVSEPERLKKDTLSLFHPGGNLQP